MLAFILIIAGFILTFSITLWLTIAVALDDHTIPVRSKLPFKNVMVVFPHPDDESLSCGGLVHMLARRGARTTLLVLTKGECGTPDASLKPTLKDIRSAELHRSANVLGFSELILEDLGDGQLSERKAQVKKTVATIMQRVQPDLVITYDRSGLYGHPDHMTLSDVVTDLVAGMFKETTLWYVSFSKQILATIHLPTHMAKDPVFMSLRLPPTHRVFTAHHTIAKIRSLMCHKSQLLGFRNAIPLKFLPLWFPNSARLFEYYTEVKSATT